MNRCWLLILLPLGAPSTAAVGWTQEPADSPATKENIEAAYKIVLASAAAYEFHVGKGEKDKPLELLRQPRLRYSNPVNNDVQGCVFVWTQEGRPLVVGNIYKWYLPQAIRAQGGLVMEHDFHSLAEVPLSATFHGKPVWTTEEAGLKFVDVPEAAAPAANEVQRRLQLGKLAREFSCVARYHGATSDTQLRLLPRPIHSYAAPKHGILEGGLFAIARGTDPEMFLLIEARGKDAATARWQYAVAPMSNLAELRLLHQKKQVWEAGLPRGRDVFGSHKLPFTGFMFNEIPVFLNEAIAKPKP
jgi:hypothetical protein